MKFRIPIQIERLSKFKNFGGDYTEVYYCSREVVLSSSGIDCSVFMKVPAIEGPNDPVCVRIPTDYFSNLHTENYLDIVVNESNIKCIFYDKKLQYMYEIELDKQNGYPDFTEKLKYLENLSEYPSLNLNNLHGLIGVLARLNTNINCIDNVIYGLFNRSYLFRKCECPNFSIPATILKKISSSCDKIYFIDGFLYGNLNDLDIHVFLNKHRVSSTSDINFILQAKFSHSIELNVENLLALNKRYNITPDTSCVVDFKNEEIVVSYSDKIIKMNTPVLSINSNRKQKTEEPGDLDVDSLRDLLNSDSSVDLNQQTNPYDMPTIIVPNWLIKIVLNQSKTKVYVNSNFIVFSFYGGKILIARADKK